MPPRLLTLLLFSLSLACIDNETARRAIRGGQASGARLDALPVVLNQELPFRYPPPLYASRVQGNVTLRIHIDSTGTIVPESTAVVESSGFPGLDSAAVKGSQELRFSPAKFHGRSLGVSLLLPIYFRHPQGHPLPGDSVLRGKREQGTGKREGL